MSSIVNQPYDGRYVNRNFTFYDFGLIVSYFHRNGYEKEILGFIKLFHREDTTEIIELIRINNLIELLEFEISLYEGSKSKQASLDSLIKKLNEKMNKYE